MLKKKTVAVLLTFSMLITTMIVPTDVFAQEEINDINLTQCDLYEHVGGNEVYLGGYDSIDSVQTLLRDNYREYDSFDVYDEGIISKWNWLSRPYFIISIAKGAKKKKSKEVKVTISCSISGNFPSEATNSIFATFGISASGSKTISETVEFYGPEGNARTRDYYYQEGTHKHLVKVVQEHKSNWDGVLWTKTYYVYVDEPAIRCYSEDH